MKYAPPISARPKSRNRTPRAFAGVVAAVVVAVGFVPADVAHGVASSGKITICHRTHSTTNPYRRISVSQNGVQNGGHGGHDLPVGYTANPLVFDPTFPYVPSGKYWEDIIPGGDTVGATYNGTTQIAKNWTPLGQAAFSSYCAKMSPTFFYQSEVDAGRTPQEAIDDLNDQQANEDIALRNALPGGIFTLANMSLWATAVSVTSNAATGVLAVAATLNGSLTVGSTSTVPSFQWGRSSTMATYTNTAASPTSVTNTTAVTTDLTGLTPGTTYYFRAVGTTNAGTDTEGVLLGNILSFTTTALDSGTVTPPVTRTLTIDPTFNQAGYQLNQTAPVITATVSAGAGTTTFSSSTLSVCSIDANTGQVTFIATGTCSIGAHITSDATYDVADATQASFPVLEIPAVSSIPGADPATTSQTSTSSTTAPTSPTTDQTNTTAPSTSTTAPTLSVPATGSVRGIVWFDRNSNGAFDANEWVLPGVTVTLTQPTSVIEGFVELSVRSDVDGSYQFNNLLLGNYRVRATASIKGFDYTSDTDGATDWVVNVTVSADRAVFADFAGLGRGELVGRMFETTTSAGLPFATVGCSWSGFDDVTGTGDDLVLSFTADVNGAFDVRGVPYGYFDCSGVEAGAGRTSEVASLSVFSPEAVLAQLPVSGLRPSGDTLPRTGSGSSDTIRLAVLLLAAGATTTRIARRRKPA